jgi:uncharacterized protein YcfL
VGVAMKKLALSLIVTSFALVGCEESQNNAALEALNNQEQTTVAEADEKSSGYLCDLEEKASGNTSKVFIKTNENDSESQYKLTHYFYHIDSKTEVANNYMLVENFKILMASYGKGENEIFKTVVPMLEDDSKFVENQKSIADISTSDLAVITYDKKLKEFNIIKKQTFEDGENNISVKEAPLATIKDCELSDIKINW